MTMGFIPTTILSPNRKIGMNYWVWGSSPNPSESYNAQYGVLRQVATEVETKNDVMRKIFELYTSAWINQAVFVKNILYHY